jgi:uncharacterized OB-fold protein
MIQSIGTYLPPWGTETSRRPGDDEDVVTMAVAAGLQAISALPSPDVLGVALVSRDLPLLEGGNAAPLLAGLGLPETVDVKEVLGGAPAALAVVADSAPGTLVLAADTSRGAGAAAVFCGHEGRALQVASRVNRSLPVVTRDAQGKVSDYADPRLLRVRGVGVSLERAGVSGKVNIVAGLDGKEASALADGDAPRLATTGASAALLALAAAAERRDGGRVLAVEQAAVAVVDVGSGGSIPIRRNEPAPQPPPIRKMASAADISISLSAYERAFDAKLRLQAARCTSCATLSYPPRYRCLGCGSEAPTDRVELPRHAEVYTAATIHVPVPGLAVPYTVVLAELGDTGVRVLVQLTGVPPGGVAIGDRGTMVFRRVAVRSGVPDYGYAFLPTTREVAA